MFDRAERRNRVARGPNVSRVKIPYRPSRDEAIEVCLEALATGCVYGVSPYHDPDILATDSAFAQNGNGDLNMWRDWGLIEAHCSRRLAGDPWRCDFFMVQAHRMRKPPKWKMLRRELERAGHDFVPGPFRTEDADSFTVIASNSSATVELNHPGHRGRAVKISALADPLVPREIPMLATEGKSTSPIVRQTQSEVRALASANPAARLTWLERKNPASGDWSWLLHQIEAVHHAETRGSAEASGARGSELVDFGLWLLGQAHERSVWPPAEWVLRWCRFVLAHPGAAPRGEVTSRSLAALPTTPAEATSLLRDWRHLSPDAVRRSRMTLALLRCAAEDVPPPPPVPPLDEWQRLLGKLR